MTVLILALLVPAISCPWMSEATADRIVGGKTAMAVTASSCEFSHGADALRIVLPAVPADYRSSLKQCKSAPEALKGIGNEAVACDGNGAEQLVIGRVRQAVFVIRLKAPFSRDLLRAKARAAAEIVSGNMY